MEPYKTIGSATEVVEFEDSDNYAEVFVEIRQRKNPQRFMAYLRQFSENENKIVGVDSVLCSGALLDVVITGLRRNAKKYEFPEPATRHVIEEALNEVDDVLNNANLPS